MGQLNPTPLRKHNNCNIANLEQQVARWKKVCGRCHHFPQNQQRCVSLRHFRWPWGVQVAQYCAPHFSTKLQTNANFVSLNYPQALEQTFQLLDQMLDTQEGERQLRSITLQNGLQPFEHGKVPDSVGCTANVILMANNYLYIANAGDSRAVLSRKGVALCLSKDHKPDEQNQKKRIEASGGVVEKGRINGHLNLSRSIGDLHYKRNLQLPSHKQVVISKPDIQQIQLTKHDQFVIMGCDGVWEKYENNVQGFVDMIRQERCNGKNPQNVLQDYFDTSVSSDPTTQQLGCDNMNAILIQFNKLML